MQRFAFPSAALPGPPSFEIEAPSDWTSEAVPGTLALLSEPPAAGAFRANVTISADRLPSGSDLAAAASRTLASARATFEDLELLQEKVVTIDGRPASLRFVTFSVEDLGHRVLQMEALVTVAGSPLHLLHLNATCLADDAEHYAEPFVKIVDSLRVLDHA